MGHPHVNLACSEVGRGARHLNGNRDNLRVVLVRTRNPLNIGASARAMSNFGFTQLRVVQPYELAFREAKSAVGAGAVLEAAEEFGSVAEAVADCALVVGTTAGRDRELQHEMVAVGEGARRIRAELERGKVAVLFGSEKRGLSNEDLSHCHWLMRIPTRDEHVSMNLGQAVAVSLYEVSIGMEGTSPRKPKEGVRGAQSAELERMTQLLLQALAVSGYVKARAGTATEEKIRRMVRRLSIPEEDAEVWMGMLRKMLWKMGVREE